MPKTYWMKLGTSPSPARQFTSKASAITTADGYVDGPSNQATSYFASSKQARRS
jgi:hypothetical protein